MGGLVEDVPGKRQPARVHKQPPPLDAQPRQEGALTQIGGFPGKADAVHEGEQGRGGLGQGQQPLQPAVQHGVDHQMDALAGAGVHHRVRVAQPQEPALPRPEWNRCAVQQEPHGVVALQWHVQPDYSAAPVEIRVGVLMDDRARPEEVRTARSGHWRRSSTRRNAGAACRNGVSA